jgi:2-C-methyl-D-erythritol 2,4-cyclodiphosphate synthase
MRTGIGFDVHRFEEGRRLVLAGIEFPGEIGLLGHSDADALTHAVIDALLGAAALGDIGRHFPPDDERWRDASSLELLRRVRAILEGEGYQPVNIDVSLVAERPRIGPKVDAMRQKLASALGISAEAVSIKATTAEGLGAIGRVEGVAAWAVALVDRMDDTGSP